MPTITFKVSDSQKHDYLWSLLNVNYNEEGGWAVEYGICDIYDEYAIVRNYAEGKFERVYYTKNDETDSLEITNREDCFIVDVNEAEKKALVAVRATNNDTYEAIDVKFEAMVADLEAANATIKIHETEVETLTIQNSEFSTKIEELTETISTLNTDKENIEALYAEANDKFTAVSNELATAKEDIVSLTEERDALATFKKDIMDNEKKAVINGYTDQLDAEIIETYMNDLDKYTAQQLDMELTYKVKTTRPDLFAKVPGASTYIPKDTTPSMGGLETLLAKYENKH
jgi:predicted transcriptional regulator